MNTINKFFFLLLMVSGLFVTSCVDNDFDEPQNTLTISDSDVVTIESILALLDDENEILFGEGNIGEDAKYIKGTVTADDASGNFFKTVIFQDGTGALGVIPDRNELNAEFPIGNIVYVKLNGLTLTFNNNLPQLGYGVIGGRLQRIPDVLVNDFLIAGGAGEDIAPIETTISDIKQNPNQFYNKLLILQEVEFSVAYVGNAYANANNPDGPETINAIIEDCDDNDIILRNSGFADFASDIVPQGKGALTAVLGVFGDDLQLFIRDTDDVMFGTERCDGSGGQASNEITIQSIQDRFYDLGADESEVGFITGTVISDRNSGQVNGQNIFVQNGEDGILVRFTAQHSFDLGDEVKITVSGQELSEFRGLLQVNNVPNFNAERTGSGNLPEARELTVSEILANNNTYESTRVLIKGAMLSGGSTFAGGIDVEQDGNTIVIFTFNESSYANDPVPSGLVDVVAIVTQYDETVQLTINSSTDITGGTVDPGGNSDNDKVNANFEGGTDFDPISLGGWLNVATKGTRVWYSRSFDDNGFAECEAFQDDNAETEAWLITPTIDTEEDAIFSFQTSQAFWQHQGLSVWISSDFTNVEDANWVVLDEARLADSGDEQYAFIDSGDIDLTDYMSGKVRIGFMYEGTAASNTTKMRIDNVVLK